ncbi:MAG: PAS domain S-box protein [Planctomycetes bacterium]|nr:PAS domain S-box protein [Planctomycetota bacterium]
MPAPLDKARRYGIVPVAALSDALRPSPPVEGGRAARVPAHMSSPHPQRRDATPRDAQLPAPQAPGNSGAPRVGLVGLGGDEAALARAALAQEGCTAESCADAEGLLARLRAGAFDLALADLDALAIGPAEFIRRVKRAAPQTPVLVLSRDGAAAAPVEALRAGAYDYLQKPVRPDELRARLRHALASRRLGLSVRQRSLQLAFVSQLSRAFGASLHLREVLRTAVGDLRALADFDLALALTHNTTDEAALVHPLTPEAEALWPPDTELPLDACVLGQHFDGTRPRLVAGCEPLPADLARLRDAGFTSLLLLPLAQRGQLIAVIVLASRSPGRFDGCDLGLLQHVGEHLASAVVNSRLYEHLKTLSAQLEDTVRERTREALEVKRHLESLLEAAGDAIITVDLSRRITSWNQGARQILGHSRDEVAGTLITLLASGEGAATQLATILDAALDGKVASNVETQWLRRDRKEVSLSLTVSPIPGTAQPLAGVLVIARDITERKRLQDELFHSEKLASIGQLAAGVAHQINNPLGAISGRAQMLLRLSGPPHQDFLRDQLAKIQADCARIAETINELLGFARKTETAKRHTDLNAVLDETLEMIRHGLTRPNIRIERRYGERLPPLLASANHLRQLFANLMTNALDAMPVGGTLTLATRCLPPTPERPEKLLEVAVTDTGVGIPPDDLARIFEPFYTTKPPGQGTGLGLAVARRIVDFHNARIDVASTPGAGTTFTVQFPLP